MLAGRRLPRLGIDTRVASRAALLQALLVGVLFAVLAVALPHTFFVHNGAIVGPLAWIGCSIATGLLLRVPLGAVAIASAASGAAAALVGVVGGHVISLPVAILVFGACCGALSARARRQPSAERARA